MEMFMLSWKRLKDGNGILRLRDKNGDGVADDISGFGKYIGTGILIKNGYLYASSNTSVYKYKLENNEIVNKDQPEEIVSGLWDKRQHSSKSLATDDAGNIYVNIGAPSNACQERDRTKGSPGRNPVQSWILQAESGNLKLTSSINLMVTGYAMRLVCGM